MRELKVIVPENARELGEAVCKHLREIRSAEAKENGEEFREEDYLIIPEIPRFNNGESKCIIPVSVRDKDLYILSDVSNHSIVYNLRGTKHNMGPDEHFMDILRIFVCF